MVFFSVDTMVVISKNQKSEAVTVPDIKILAKSTGRDALKLPKSKVPSIIAWGFIQVTVKHIAAAFIKGWSTFMLISDIWFERIRFTPM